MSSVLDRNHALMLSSSQLYCATQLQGRAANGYRIWRSRAHSQDEAVLIYSAKGAGVSETVSVEAAISIRLPSELLATARERAQSEDRSLSSVVRQALIQHVERDHDERRVTA